MSLGVIYLLEVVEVDAGQWKGMVIASCPQHLFFHLLTESFFVEQASQTVGVNPQLLPLKGFSQLRLERYGVGN